MGLLLCAGVAEAQRLHAYGPAGSPTERRCFLIVEDASGGCASWDELEVEGAGVEVELGQRHGECVREVWIRSDTPQPSATLQVRGPDLSLQGEVALGEENNLRVRATRRGSRVQVRVPGPPAEVHAYWAGGSTPLEQVRPGRYRGNVPRSGIVAVRARRGDRVGAHVVGRAEGRSVLIVRSELSVPAGGSPRSAAFVVVTDRQGRPSRNVPLQVRSERGALEWLRWQGPGLAAVGLSAPRDAATVDLEVRSREAHAFAQLPVAAGWPTQGSVVAQEATVGESLVAQLSATDVLGEPLVGDRVRIRCDAEDCIADRAGSLRIVLQAEVDGRWVPLDVVSVEVHEAPTLAPADLALERGVHLGARVGLGLDGFRRVTGFVGAELSLALVPRFWIGLSATYCATRLSASSATDDAQARASQHGSSVELFADVGLLRWLFVRAGGGISFTRTRMTVEGDNAREYDTRGLLHLGLANKHTFGRFWLGGFAGARVAFAQRSVFEEPTLRFMLEVRGGWTR